MLGDLSLIVLAATLALPAEKRALSNRRQHAL